jgi:hypothetical protein
MKKILGLMLFAFLIVGVALCAESPIYAKVVIIQKVYSHEKGYKVTFFTAQGDLSSCYIPIEWFYPGSDFKTDDGFSKAELVIQQGPDAPHLEIFWKNGTFHHLRLFVNADNSARSWGVVRPGDHLETKFDPNKPITFQF